MTADTSAALIAQLDVKFDQLANNMKKAMTVFDNGGRKLEKRQKEIKARLSDWTLDFSGIKGISGALAGLTAAGIGVGLADIVKKSLEAASAIGDVARSAGVGVEFLQKLRFAASQSGASFDIADEALVTLNKTFGDFVNTGAGKGAATFKALGIDKLINAGDVRNTEQVFDVLVKKVNSFGSEAQKSAFLASVFGKEAGPKMLQLVEQGTGGLARLEAQAVSLGIVLSEKTVEGARDANDKLSALFNVIKAEGISAVAGIAPEIAHLAKEITDGLPDLIIWVEKWADWFGILKLSPVQKLKGEIKDVQDQITSADTLKQSWLTNPFGIMSLNINKTKAGLVARLKGLQADLAKAVGETPAAAPRSNAAGGPKLHVAQTAADIAAAKRAKELAEHRADLLAQTGADAKTAAAALLVAQDETSVALLKGSSDYYAAVKKQIDDEYQVKADTAEAEAAKQKVALGKQGKDWKGYADAVANINQGMNDKIAAADEERKKKQFESGPGALIQQAVEQGRRQVEQYGYETAALGLTAGAAAKLVFQQSALAEAHAKQIPITQELTDAINTQAEAVGRAAQSAHDAAEKSADNIALTDELRSGFTEVGIAGAHGFKSLEDAAGQFGNALEDILIQLYVMKPIINSLLGPSGTSGGGLIGALLSSIPGFASGTNSAPGGLAIVGERGPELVNLPRGSQVIPNVRAAAGTTMIAPVINIDARYATRGVAEEISAQLRTVAPQIIQVAVRQSDLRTPANMRKANRDTF